MTPAAARTPARRARATWLAMFEPERYPPPRLSGASLAWRYLLCLAWFALTALAYALAHQVGRGTGDAAAPIPAEGELADLRLPAVVMALDGVLGVVSLAIIHLRRRFPLAICLVIHGFMLISATSAPVGGWALISLASRRQLPRTLIALGVGLAVALGSYLWPWSAALSAPVIVAAFVGQALFALLGAYLGVRRDRQASFHARVEQADRDREFAVLAERNRIAREMHDVLAHRISLVSMHAGALAYRTDLPPEQTQEIARVIQENAHASLTELRSVLSTLREGPSLPGDAAQPVAPQPTLGDLPGLLADARALGQVVDLRGTLAPGLPLVQQRHLFRIAQEALTNARKHAPRARVAMLLEGAPASGVHLRVTNDVTQVGGGVPGAALGLVGVTERVQMLGGRVDAGVHEGRFVLDAWLPWDHRR